MRFSVNLPIMLDSGTGLTRDFSLRGVYFITDHPLSVGETFNFTISMKYAVPDSPMCLRCQGKVLRVEPETTGTGVAAALSSYCFEKMEQAGI